MGGEPWRQEDIDVLRGLWAEGETAAAIAVRLGGVSRSAVLGKIFRLRLGAPAKPSDANAQTAPQRRRASTVIAIVPPVKSVRQGKMLHELTNICCRWPYKRPGTEKYFFCGVPEADLEGGAPYCPRHMKRAYLVPPPLSLRKPWTTANLVRAEQRHANRNERAALSRELRRVFGGR
ncbi:MAG TPA: GcrA family cell cycle regulator [Xanthobacteraceae bacterium]|jgi:GcrA cell cycle regulator|nr:GcrA family cell cycle regulator [Xanthobacteraceae bacterium]